MGDAFPEATVTYDYLILKQIAQHACVLAEREFTYEKAVDRCREILASL
jgi:hypothetical protein